MMYQEKQEVDSSSTRKLFLDDLCYILSRYSSLLKMNARKVDFYFHVFFKLVKRKNQARNKISDIHFLYI